MTRRHISKPERAALRATWNHTCAYCGARSAALLPEHVEPLSRGGEDTPENVVAACQGCNANKSDMFLLEWVLVRTGFWDRRGPSVRHCGLADALDVNAVSLLVHERGKR